MISGSHVIVYSRDADADRAFFQDVLQLPSVDAGSGWLIFRAASGRGRRPSGGEERRPRALPDLRRPRLDRGGVEGTRDSLRGTDAGALGNPDRDPPAGRRAARPLPAATSDGDGIGGLNAGVQG
jgi:catechol 2,3-dioxygenase-like lactoylglutathione lyase family enzyme